MIAAMAAWMRKHPVPAFYILAFLITWLGWLPQTAYSRGFFPFDSPFFYFLGGFGPLLAVFIMRKVIDGKVDYANIFRPLWQWQAGWAWYLVALLGYPAMWIAALGLSGGLKSGLTNLDSPLSLVSTFFIAFLAAIPEQVAWRGFALPRLQKRYTALTSSLVIGVLWALWHLPLLWNVNNIMSTYPFMFYFLDVIARSIIHTWIYNSTRGSLLYVTLFHAASNTVGSFIGYENVVISFIFVSCLLLTAGPTHLSRHHERPAQKDGVAAPAS